MDSRWTGRARPGKRDAGDGSGKPLPPSLPRRGMAQAQTSLSNDTTTGLKTAQVSSRCSLGCLRHWSNFPTGKVSSQIHAGLFDNSWGEKFSHESGSVAPFELKSLGDTTQVSTRMWQRRGPALVQIGAVFKPGLGDERRPVVNLRLTASCLTPPPDLPNWHEQITASRPHPPQREPGRTGVSASTSYILD